MGIGKRIKEARLNRGLTQEDLARMLGVTKGAVANYENEVSHPKEPVMYALIDALGVEPNFLFQDCVDIGTKKAPSLSDEAMKIARTFDCLDDWGKRQVQAVAENELSRCAAQARSDVPPTVEKIVYINPAAAGTPLYAESDFERVSVPAADVPQGADFGIRISGQSMEPTVRDGAIAWVRKDAELSSGQVGIFMLNDSAVCKRFFQEADGTIRLESDNPDYGPVPIREFDRFEIVGKVLL